MTHSPAPDGTTTRSAAAPRTLPAIRQLALLMLCWCVGVAVLLYGWGLRPTAAVHQPERSQAALAAVLAAVVPDVQSVPGVVGSSPEGQNPLGGTADLGHRVAVAKASLPAACAALPADQGVPLYEDVAEQWAQVDRHLRALSTQTGQLRQRYRLDLPRWVAQWHTPVNAAECAQQVQALRRLASPRGAVLWSQARWHEPAAGASSAGSAGPAGLFVQLAEHSLARLNPWRGWPGCLWLEGGAKGTPAAAATYVPTGQTAVDRQACALAQAVPADPWAVPPDLPRLLTDLEALRLPQGKLYDDYVATRPTQRHQRQVGHHPVDSGFDLHLTIDPQAQTVAQRVAACYTGQREACAALGLTLAQTGSLPPGPGAPRMWESAAARMVAVAIIDVATGGIDALASAHTRCYAQDHGSVQRDASCPPLWQAPRRQPDALLNHAVFTDYMPGSTVKPVMASVFFDDVLAMPTVAKAGQPSAAQRREQLSYWLARSDSNRFNDELFCLTPPGASAAASPGRDPSRRCDRLARVQRRAASLGWNAGCAWSVGSAQCGQGDVLFGALAQVPGIDGGAGAAAALPARALQRRWLLGRFWTEPDPAAKGRVRLSHVEEIASSAYASCRDDQGQWSAQQCQGTQVHREWVSEAFGQQEARATALGVATMMGRLTAVARGEGAAWRGPHVVAAVTDAQGGTVMTAAMRVAAAQAAGVSAPQADADRLSADSAQAVLQALQRASQPGGTGHAMCKHVLGTERCRAWGARWAGKTGTPSFDLDEDTLAQAQRRCGSAADDGAGRGGCGQRPIKWFVAAYTDHPDGVSPGVGRIRHNKVMAVMSERNWYLMEGAGLPKNHPGRVHGLEDDTNNISTEVALRILAATWRAQAQNPP